MGFSRILMVPLHQISGNGGLYPEHIHVYVRQLRMYSFLLDEFSNALENP